MPGPTILIVEDEPPVRELLARTLRGEGYEVLEARNGAEAVAQFRARPGEIALVITDMRLPYMSGEDLVAWLRQRGEPVKLICISGYGRNVPADWNCGYIEKPFTRQQLLTEVRRVLGAE